MNNEESIRFCADEIAEIISDAEWVQKNGGSDYEKKSAKISAYDSIIELIRGRDA